MSEKNGTKKARLGILLVHGIGEQPEGDTLLSFGEPLITWLNRWLGRDAAGRAGCVKVVQAMLTPSKLGKPEPPHAIVQVMPRNGESPQEWVVAESWWSGDIHQPAFGKMAGWMMTVGAWSILSHVTKHIGRHRNKVVNVMLQIVAMVKWIVLASLLQITVLVLMAFTVVPIPGTRAVLSRILLAITGVLGDCYVLIESDLQRSSIVNRTREALHWLGEQSESVVVVAHSQGAAVAHLSLRADAPTNVASLVTFGSGLQKLEELTRLKDRPGSVRTVARLMPLFLVAFALLIHVTRFDPWDDLSEYEVIAPGVILFFAAILGLVIANEHWKSALTWMPKLALPGQKQLSITLRWTDLYASRDPVSNGAMAPDEKRIADNEEQVRNQNSVLGDHTTYWQNRVQFIPKVARAVAASAGLTLFDPEEEERLEQASVTHNRRVLWLSVSFWASWAAVAVLLVEYQPWLKKVGQAAKNGLIAIGGPAETAFTGLRSVIETAFDARPGLRSVIETAFDTGPEPELTLADVQALVLGLGVCLIALLLWRAAYRALWMAWDNTALESVLRPDYLKHPVDQFLVNAFAMGAALAPVLAVSAAPAFAYVPVGNVISVVLLGVLAVSFLAVLVSQNPKAFKGIAGLRAARGKDHGTRAKELAAEVAPIGALLLLLGIVVPSFVKTLLPVQRVAFGTFIALAVVGVVFVIQRDALARIKRWTTRRLFYLVVALTPVIVTGVLVPLMLATTSVLHDEGWSSVPFLSFITYLMPAGLLWVVTWLLTIKANVPAVPE